jgi:hypothetical protein
MRLAVRLSLVLSVLLGIVVAPPGRAAEEEPASASSNVEHLANVPYELRYNSQQPDGTDMELRTIGDRDYAFAGTYRNGLQIIDVTDPASPEIAAVYDCGVAQGDVQIFTKESAETVSTAPAKARGTGKGLGAKTETVTTERIIVAYAADDYSASYTKPESRCFVENGIAEIRYGTFFVDVTDPTSPQTAGFVEFPKGSHNQTVHPSGDFLYNSNSELGPGTGVIEVVDISDLANPREVATLPLDTGLDSHDITFNADGTRAYSAAISHTLVIDTTDPANPSVIGRIIDPTINIHHQSDPIEVGDKTLLIVTDELAGAAGNGFCPGGGLHIFDITGDRERLPVKVGYFNIPDARPTAGASITCTSHVLKIHPDEMLMTIAWYAAGTRIVDLSGLAEPVPSMAEVGHAYFDDSDTWSAKALEVTRDGTFHVFANDMLRGFDVFAVTLDRGAPPSGDAGLGQFLTPSELAAERLTSLTWVSTEQAAPYCVLRAS